MDDSLKSLVIGFILFTLFGLMILGAVITTGTTYSKDLTEVAGGSLDYDKFNDTASSFQDNAEDLQRAFNRQNVWSAIAGVVVEGVFGIAIDMINMILVPFDILNDIILDVLGVPPIFSSVILAILIISIMFAVWQLIKVGN